MCFASLRALISLGIRVVELLLFVETVVMAHVVEAAVGTVLTSQHGQAVESDTLGGAGGVVVNGTEREGGCRGAGGHRHHGGQNQGEAVCHVFVGGTSQGRRVT